MKQNFHNSILFFTRMNILSTWNTWPKKGTTEKAKILLEKMEIENFILMKLTRTPLTKQQRRKLSSRGTSASRRGESRLPAERSGSRARHFLAIAVHEQLRRHRHRSGNSRIQHIRARCATLVRGSDKWRASAGGLAVRIFRREEIKGFLDWSPSMTIRCWYCRERIAQANSRNDGKYKCFERGNDYFG